MNPASGHYPVETMRERLRDYSRRITQLERAPVMHYTIPPVTMVAVATVTDVPPDSDSAVYVVANGTVVHQGVTRTLAEWQATQGP